MRNREEVVHAFTPNPKLNEIQKQALLRTEMAFKELATEVVDLVPECADRTAALRKLLEAKMTCVQAITHANTGAVQAPAPAQVTKEQSKHGKENKKGS